MTDPHFFITADQARERGLEAPRGIIIALAIMLPFYALVAWAVFG